MEISKEKDANTRSGAGKKIIITKEHSITDIAQYHKDGYSVHFDGTDENFIDLDDEDFAKLPKSLMVYYVTAMKEHQGKLKEMVDTIQEADTPSRTFGYDKRVADPKDQLAVKLNIPGFRSSWVRCYDNEIATKERNGYVMARGNVASTFTNDGSKPGGHYVGSEDKPELVLMLISDENYKKNEWRVKKKSALIKEAAKEQLKDSAEGLRGALTEVEEK